MYFKNIQPKNKEYNNRQLMYDQEWIYIEKSILDEFNINDKEINDNFNLGEKLDCKTIQENMRLDILEKKYNNLVFSVLKKYFDKVDEDINYCYGVNVDNLTTQYRLWKNYIDALYCKLIYQAKYEKFY